MRVLFKLLNIGFATSYSSLCATRFELETANIFCINSQIEINSQLILTLYKYIAKKIIYKVCANTKYIKIQSKKDIGKSEAVTLLN